MTPDLTFFLLAIPAVIFAGISKGGFGSGASFLAAPMLALVVDPAVALGFLLPLLLLIDVATLRPFWGQWDWPDVKMLVAGAVPGVALGVVFLGLANPDVMRLVLGLVCLGFVTFQGLKAQNVIRMPQRPLPPWVGLVTGGLGGFTGFVSHAGGPFVAIYLLAKGMSKTTYQATTVITFFVINIMKAGLYVPMGLIPVEMLTVGLYLAPAALFGTWVGVWAHRKIPERLFFSITYVLLTITGAKLIFDALV